MGAIKSDPIDAAVKSGLSEKGYGFDDIGRLTTGPMTGYSTESLFGRDIAEATIDTIDNIENRTAPQTAYSIARTQDLYDFLGDVTDIKSKATAPQEDIGAIPGDINTGVAPDGTLPDGKNINDEFKDNDIQPTDPTLDIPDRGRGQDTGSTSVGGTSTAAAADTSQGQTGYGSCFIAGTKVTMSDGTLKNIENIVVGDKVKGHKKDNEVIKLDPTLLANRKLYSFNDNNHYFFTSEHPFMTEEGWKSIKPEKTKERDGSGVDALASKFGLIPGVFNCGVGNCDWSSDAGAFLLNKPLKALTSSTSCLITASLGGTGAPSSGNIKILPPSLARITAACLLPLFKVLNAIRSFNESGFNKALLSLFDAAVKNSSTCCK